MSKSGSAHSSSALAHRSPFCGRGMTWEAPWRTRDPPSRVRRSPTWARGSRTHGYRGSIAASHTKRLPLEVRRAPPERTGRLDSRSEAPPHVRQHVHRWYGKVLTRVDAINAAFQLRGPGSIHGFLVGLWFGTNARQERSRGLRTHRLGQRQGMVENRVDRHVTTVRGDVLSESPANLAAIARPRPLQKPQNAWSMSCPSCSPPTSRLTIATPSEQGDVFKNSARDASVTPRSRRHSSRYPRCPMNSDASES